jgi:hypothetical protein
MFAMTHWSTNMLSISRGCRALDSPWRALRRQAAEAASESNIVVVVFVEAHIFV